MKSPTDEEIEKYIDANIRWWNDPEYLAPANMRNAARQAAKWARDQQPKPTCDRDCPECEFGACSHPGNCVKQITYGAETFVLQRKLKPLEWIEEHGSLVARPFDFAGLLTGPYYRMFQIPNDGRWYLGWSEDGYAAPYESREKAEAKAQADYQERVKKMGNYILIHPFKLG